MKSPEPFHPILKPCLPWCESPLARWFALAGFVTAAVSPASALTSSWNDVSGNWSTAGNWTGSIPTSAGDIANFTVNYSVNNKTATIDTTSRTVGTLNIGDPGVGYWPVTIAASGGASLIFNNSGGGALLSKTTTTTNNVLDTISAPVSLADNLTVNMTDTTVNSLLRISSVISETGGTRSVTKNGNGILQLGPINTSAGPASTFSGGFTLNAGEVHFSGNSVFGNGTLTINSGTLSARGAARTPANSVLVGGDFTLGGTAQGGNLLTLAGPVDLGGSTRNLSVAASGGAAISGVISNGGLVKTSLGTTLTLSGANSYAGGTAVTGGTLLANNTSGSGTGAGTVEVNNGATLGGTGTIAGPVTVESGGTLNAGTSGAIGTLTLASTPVLGGQVMAHVNRNGGSPSADVIAVPGNPINYGGTLAISNLGANLQVGDAFTLFTGASHHGGFSSIVGPPGSTLAFANGVLTVTGIVYVPEVFIIGDSTVNNSGSQRGWGQEIYRYFSSSVSFTNNANPGESSKTFISENRWANTISQVAENDIVLIQFGHNDSHDPQYPESTDANVDYKTNLQTYIDDTRAKGAIPVLVTPMHRRNFVNDVLQSYTLDGGGYPMDLAPYAASVKQVALANNVACVDLFTQSGTYMQLLGDEQCKSLLVTGDRTHWNQTGAIVMAGMVAKGLSAALSAAASSPEEQHITQYLRPNLYDMLHDSYILPGTLPGPVLALDREGVNFSFNWFFQSGTAVIQRSTDLTTWSNYAAGTSGSFSVPQSGREFFRISQP